MVCTGLKNHIPNILAATAATQESAMSVLASPSSSFD